MADVSVRLVARAGLIAAFALAATAASAQTYGFATLPAGTASHVIASAISKSMKEKAGINMLVQPAFSFIDLDIADAMTWLAVPAGSVAKP